MIGKAISHYLITGILRQSSTSTLYAAADTILGRKVAINVPSFGSDAEREHFIRNIKARSYIYHPGVEGVYEYGETEAGVAYVVLEWVEGRSVAELLRAGSLTLASSVEIAESVAEALSALHASRVVHRDIKPSNIVLSEQGRVKILDFGLARSISEGKGERPRTGETRPRGWPGVGTLAYMAPEQLMGSESDERSDLFSLGATLYETLTGRPPFVGETPGEVIERLIRSSPPRPSELNPRVPDRLDRVVLKAIAKKPEFRFQTAGELAEALDSIRRGVVMTKGGFKPDLFGSGGVEDASSVGMEPAEPERAMLYFVLEGERAAGDVVECGSDVDLIFNYSIPPKDALAAFWGERFEKILSGEVALGVTVVADGFNFRDGVWHKVAKFSEGALAEPVRFQLKASEKVVEGAGFFITLSLYESVLYQLPLRVRLVKSLDEATPPAARDWSLDLDLYKILSEQERASHHSGAKR